MTQGAQMAAQGRNKKWIWIQLKIKKGAPMAAQGKNKTTTN